MAARKTPISKLSFSEAVAEVEAIVARLESEQTDVDELAAEVERAVELIAACRARLERTDREVRDLVVRLAPADEPDQI
ncbi:MAG TPA: exodeoxyribonuclease VII small subunit [Candidatus Krumholzibacteria bacterium]|nr:exodeoxyribonuclease VII small subunit [Candidatus Krumholzibacteria bacterium]HPD71143.1 exodeoxyribonuclease VII small subunit [Candidatus Krumholzibacteria bacterium]HRY39157.1 exodeoxyribonuclease VII small subunit [Candidatus Krumholzibacteria bacterium]